MKKFRLQKLLDIKIKDEEESKILYTQAQNRKKNVEDNLRNLESNYVKYSDISKAKDIVSQKITFNYLSSIMQSIKTTNDQLIEEEKNVNKAKEDLLEKQIKRKSLEKLKENTLERIRKEEERIEQINNDEFALYAYMRNSEKIS